MADAMGLESGDVLLEINGYDLGTLDGQMAAYTELQDEVVLTLLFERRGELDRHTYRIVD
jgi:hypothetical protein